MPLTGYSQSNQESNSLKTAGKSEESDEAKSLVPVKNKLFWAFLCSGKSLEGVEAKKVEEMQSAHLENFKRLAHAGKLLSAGSVTDPTEALQGVAVFSTSADESLMQLFQDDELICGGYQKIQAAKMRLEHGIINAGQHGRSGMQEYRMVLLDSAKKVGEDNESARQLIDQSQKFVESMYREKELRLAIRLGENKAGQLILVLDKPEQETSLKNRLQKIPAVKSGLWKLRVMPVFFGKGTLNQS